MPDQPRTSDRIPVRGASANIYQIAIPLVEALEPPQGFLAPSRRTVESQDGPCTLHRIWS